MANPYRGGSETRVASGEGRPTAPKPKQPAPPMKKSDTRPTGPTGQPNFPVGMPPMNPGAGGPTRISDQEIMGPMAGPRPYSGGMGIPMGPQGTGFGPGGPANVSQGGPGGSLADDIVNDTLGKRKPGQGSGGKHGG